MDADLKDRKYSWIEQHRGVKRKLDDQRRKDK